MILIRPLLRLVARFSPKVAAWSWAFVILASVAHGWRKDRQLRRMYRRLHPEE